MTRHPVRLRGGDWEGRISFPDQPPDALQVTVLVPDGPAVVQGHYHRVGTDLDGVATYEWRAA